MNEREYVTSLQFKVRVYDPNEAPVYYRRTSRNGTTYSRLYTVHLSTCRYASSGRPVTYTSEAKTLLTLIEQGCPTPTVFRGNEWVPEHLRGCKVCGTDTNIDGLVEHCNAILKADDDDRRESMRRSERASAERDRERAADTAAHELFQRWAEEHKDEIQQVRDAAMVAWACEHPEQAALLFPEEG